MQRRNFELRLKQSFNKTSPEKGSISISTKSVSRSTILRTIRTDAAEERPSMATNQSDVFTTHTTTTIAPQTIIQSLELATTTEVATITQIQTMTAAQTQIIDPTTSIDDAASTQVSSPSSLPVDAGTNEAAPSFTPSSAPSQVSQNDASTSAESSPAPTQAAQSEAPSPLTTSTTAAAAIDSAAPSSTSFQSSQTELPSSSPTSNGAAIIEPPTPSSAPTQVSPNDLSSSSTSLDPASTTSAPDSLSIAAASSIESTISSAESSTSFNNVPSVSSFHPTTFQTSTQSLTSPASIASSTAPSVTSSTKSNSPTPPPSSIPQTASSPSVTAPTIIGMTIGSIALLTMLLTLIYIFIRRRRAAKSRQSSWIGTPFGKDDMAPPSYGRNETDNLWPGTPSKQSFQTSPPGIPPRTAPLWDQDRLITPQTPNYMTAPPRPSRSPPQTPLGWATDLREPRIPQLLSKPQSPIRKYRDPRQTYDRFTMGNPWWRESRASGSAGRGTLTGDGRGPLELKKGLKRKESLQYPTWDPRTMGTPI